MTVFANERDSEYDSENDVESSDNPDSDEEDENVELFGIKHSCPLNELRGGSRDLLPSTQCSASMTHDQSWGSVWPTPRTFHPATVPLPARKGVIQTKAQVVPSKHANAELMKIPNFLHLTPPTAQPAASSEPPGPRGWRQRRKGESGKRRRRTSSPSPCSCSGSMRRWGRSP